MTHYMTLKKREKVSEEKISDKNRSKTVVGGGGESKYMASICGVGGRGGEGGIHVCIPLYVHVCVLYV